MSLRVRIAFEVLVVFIFCTALFGQDQDYFRSPIGHDTRLSGSFAEPRSAHFHAGIDFKQKKGVPYDTIYAAADGFISRINIMPDGYGNALYIDHPNGYTTVYAHLHHFNEPITDYISDVMIKKRIHKIEHYPKAQKLKVSKGDYIGILGNTGRSFGAHLHFEIRKTDSETPVNPALFNLKPKDNLPPTIRGIVIYSLTPDGEVLDQDYYSVVATDKDRYTLKQELIRTDALMVGIGIHAYDTMNGASNHNGAYGVSLKNNGREIHSFKMDSVSFDHSRYIHAHMDYEAKINNRYISKCYNLDSNPLEIYDTTLTSGRIITSDLIANHLEIDVYDIEGNRATVEFDLIREDDEFKPNEIDTTYIRVTPVKPISGSRGKFKWEAPEGIVEKPEYLKIDSNGDTLNIRGLGEVPMFRYLKLSYTSDKELTKSTLIATQNKKGQLMSLGCEAKDSISLVTFVNRTGRYWIDRDTVAPNIKVLNLPKGLSRRIRFKMSDNYESSYYRDQLRFEVYIDDTWVLCQHDIKNNTVWHDIDFIPTNQIHKLKVKVSDSCGNVTEVTKSFKY